MIQKNEEWAYDHTKMHFKCFFEELCNLNINFVLES
jgi:hypothetical protein